jgi:hypothetical protein
MTMVANAALLWHDDVNERAIPINKHGKRGYDDS